MSEPINYLDECVCAMLEKSKSSMALFKSDHIPVNMYALLRQDLCMSPGKLAAQAGHAFSRSLEQARLMGIDIAAYQGSGNGTKICMYAKNLNQLLRARRECEEAGIAHYLIIDRGHILLPHFNGEPIITGLGIGPIEKEKAKAIVGRYRMID